MLHVASLFFYPIKGCAGTSLKQAMVGPRGIQGDREWMVVESDSGEFITQRECPALALVQPQPAADSIRLSAPGFESIDVPIRRDDNCRKVHVWRDWCDADDQGDEAARWFTAYLGVRCRLVRMPDANVRPVDPTYRLASTDQVGFADGYPFLLTSVESLADLNERLTEPLPMNRFRPNIVIAGAGASFAEDRMRSFRIGEVTFFPVKPCARCVVTTTDQRTLARGDEPLATLATFRKNGSKVLFGQNLVHVGDGELTHGDELSDVEWKV
jgi:uncharacterized protein YcbX